MRANSWMKSAPSAKVHQVLVPLMTQSSPSRVARQETLARSEPASGSDSEEGAEKFAARHRAENTCASAPR